MVGSLSIDATNIIMNDIGVIEGLKTYNPKFQRFSLKSKLCNLLLLIIFNATPKKFKIFNFILEWF